jgi:hypothetical protein
VGVDLLAQLLDRHAGGQVGGGRPEHVTAGERRARRRQLVHLVRQGEGPLGATGHGDGRGHEPVVGADEDPVAAGDLRAVRVGKSYRLAEDDVDRYLAQGFTEAG